MAPLRYSINVTVDGCCDHRVVPADEELHRRAAATIERADAVLLGRVTFEMMRTAFGPGTGADLDDPFVRAIGAVRKHVVSNTLPSVDWDAELVRGDLADGVREVKARSVRGVYVGGVRLPTSLAQLGLIDEYEFVVHPRIAGHGPSLFAGITSHVDLELVGEERLDSGAVALRYEPRRP